MLFKVFTVLSAISLLGGFANCQLSIGNQNDQLMKFLADMMSSAADANKNSNENQMMQLLLNSFTGAMKKEEQAIQTLIKMFASGSDATKSNDNQMMKFWISLMSGNKDAAMSNDNQLMQLFTMMLGSAMDPPNVNENQVMKLLTVLMGGAKDTAKVNENQMMQLLSLLGSGKDSTKINENQMMQFLTKAMFGGSTGNGKNSENQMMQFLTKAMFGGSTGNGKNSENQMMQMLMMSMLGSATDKSKNNELAKSMKDSINALSQMFPRSDQINNWLDQLMLITDGKKKPAQCIAAQNMDRVDEFGVSAWVEMLKTDSLKELFGSQKDYKKFTEMVEYIEGNRRSDWLSKLLKSIKRNDWIMNIAEQIISMVENDQSIQDELIKFIRGNKEVLDFTLNVIEWMELQNFSDSSPMIQKVVSILLGLDLKESQIDGIWFDNYMNWVDCTFDKDGEISAVMRTLGMLSKVDMLGSFLQNMMGNYTKENKIDFSLELRNVCTKKFKLPQQSLLDILNYVVTENLFCSVKKFTTVQRNSIVTRERGTFIGSVVGIPFFGSTWVAQVSRGGRIVAKDVDVNYVPKNGDLIEVYKYA